MFLNPLPLIKGGLSAAGSFLGGIQTYLIVGASCVALGLAGGAFSTYKIMHNANAAAATQQAKATVQYLVGAGRIGADLGVLYVPQFIFIHDNTSRIQQEIPQHVTPQIDRSYPVPLGFVRVFNDASHGAVPGPAAGGDADPSGVHFSDVAHAHAADEGTLDACRKMNDEWWDWYDRNASLWNKTKVAK